MTSSGVQSIEKLPYVVDQNACGTLRDILNFGEKKQEPVLAEKQPNKRRNYFINPAFQLKFSVFVSLISLASSIVYPFIIYGLFDTFLKTVTLPEKGVEILNSRRSEIFKLLVVYQVFFTGLVFFSCILISHKIAGPIYKARQYIRQLIEGKSALTIRFREKDNFQDLAEDLQDLANSINQKSGVK